ncbi:Uncharacterized protein TCM_013031 [Theobroma cacao]|uniref:Uncharacterized protein n=1 Tax=Theobroma cacao TaxID=3641 RepID=A0A061FW35_THECC|nr:Uncharacterized protein TCM_013031 [Theobroma cacao]
MQSTNVVSFSILYCVKVASPPIKARELHPRTNSLSISRIDTLDIEVKKAIFNIEKDSEVGLDGFSSLFYQHYWAIVAKDLLEAVKEFFNGATFLKGVTSMTFREDLAYWTLTSNGDFST